jgi:hypothetical protein
MPAPKKKRTGRMEAIHGPSEYRKKPKTSSKKRPAPKRKVPARPRVEAIRGPGEYKVYKKAARKAKRR